MVVYCICRANQCKRSCNMLNLIGQCNRMSIAAEEREVAFADVAMLAVATADAASGIRIAFPASSCLFWCINASVSL